MRMEWDSCELFELLFNGHHLIIGRVDAFLAIWGGSVAVHEIVQAVFKRNYGIVSDPFVTVGNDQRDEMVSDIHTSRPEDMVKHRMTKGWIAGQTDDPGGPNLGVVAPVTDAIGFCQVMQECSGPDGGCGITGKAPG
jgi:hypothetical protein